MEHSPTKLTDIFLEDDTLTLWRPSQNDRQYHLMPATLKQEGDCTRTLQTFYTKFDCVTSILTFDDAIPVIAEQRTTLKPTDDYSVLRDYPRIQGLWFKPDFEEKLGPNEQSTVGNLKLSISLSPAEKECFFTNMNVYFLEVLDYPSEDKSVSRLLLSKTLHDKFPKYDVFKPGGPVHVIRKVDPMIGEVEVHFLRMSSNHNGQRWRHEVEFMLEDDPWPLCKIIPINNRCFKRPSLAVARQLGFSLPTRYIGATWRETLAGLFIWALRTHLVWLVFERLHIRVKTALDNCVENVEIKDVIFTDCPYVCPEMFDTYEHLATFITKCENEQELKELLNIFLSLHRCNDECSIVALKTLNSTKVLQGILFLLEKMIACASPNFRYEMTSTILPWAVMGYYCSDQKIKSHRKMVIFISQTEGINTDLNAYNIRSPSPMFLQNGSSPSSGYESSLASSRTPRSGISSGYRKPHYASQDSFHFRGSISDE